MDDRPTSLSMRGLREGLLRWLLLGAVLTAFLPGARAETRLAGTVAQDQTWEDTNGPYRLAGEVRIQAGMTVRIDPGVVVHFEKGCHFVIDGKLFAEKAVFDGQADIHNREHLIFNPQSQGRFKGCVFRNLALELQSSRIEVRQSVIANHNGSGITVGKACQPTITQNDFLGNSYYAVYKEGGDTLRTPHNYWGALDGPSGAGPGQGDAVNPPIDFMPFEGNEIGEHLVLVNKRLDSPSIRPGERLSLTYGIANLNSFAHTVILGASIYDDPARHIHSPAQDLTVSIEPGDHEFSRGFVVPESLSDGVYTVLWGVMKTDLTAYYALQKDPARLHIGTTPPFFPPPAKNLGGSGAAQTAMKAKPLSAWHLGEGD